MHFDEDLIKEASQNIAIVAHILEMDGKRKAGFMDEAKRTIMASFGNDPMGEALISFANFNSTIPNASKDTKYNLIKYEQKFKEVYSSDYKDTDLMHTLFLDILGFWDIGVLEQAEYESAIKELTELGAISIDREFFTNVYSLLHEGALEKKKELLAKAKRGNNWNPFEANTKAPQMTDEDKDEDEDEDKDSVKP